MLNSEISIATNDLCEAERFQIRRQLEETDYSLNYMVSDERDLSGFKVLCDFLSKHCEGKTVYSIGAGSGFAEEFIRTYGVKVKAFDLISPKSDGLGAPLEPSFGNVQGLPEDMDKAINIVFGDYFDAPFQL